MAKKDIRFTETNVRPIPRFGRSRPVVDEATKEALRKAAATRGMVGFCEECGTGLKAEQTVCPECGQGADEMAKKTSSKSKKKVDTQTSAVVESNQSAATQDSPEQASQQAPEQTSSTGEKTVELKFKGHSKNGKSAIYSGVRGTVRFPLSAFPDKTAPQSIQIEDVFVAPPAKMTKEERKAARANAPKPTLAEKIAKREEALARLKAKLEAEGAPAQQAETEAAAEVGAEL